VRPETVSESSQSRINAAAAVGLTEIDACVEWLEVSIWLS
jgi:hypothetical protein